LKNIWKTGGGITLYFIVHQICSYISMLRHSIYKTSCEFIVAISGMRTSDGKSFLRSCSNVAQEQLWLD